MKTNMIYCFSGSGNSLYIAKSIAEATSSTIKFINRKLFNEELCMNYNQLGIIFPVYHQNIPVIVMEFIEKLRSTSANYVYAISTYGDRPTLALKYLKQLLKKEDIILNNGFAIQLPYNYLKPNKIGKGFYDSFSIKIPNEQICKAQYNNAEKKLSIIIKSIKESLSGSIEVSDSLVENFVDILNLRDSVQKKQWLKVAGYTGAYPKTFKEAVKLMDEKFQVTELCNSCGLCKKICPTNNITFINEKPKWNHNCEQCMACLHWCPNGAIIYGNNVGKSMQYRHPKISVKDLINYGGK